MPDTPHVALLIETSRSYGRGLLQGVIRYQGEHDPWSIYFHPHGLGDPPPAWLKDWRGDGILARIETQALANAILKTKLPTVDLRFRIPGLNLPNVGIDNRAVVQLAFDHLADRGFQNFAFCGYPGNQLEWMELRREVFIDHVKAMGNVCHVFEANSQTKRPKAWEQEQQQLADWVLELPKPVGVMACNDDRGQQLLDACHRADVQVPDEVAVIGVDDDLYMCNLSRPSLSSVDVNAQGVGYEAACLLERLMQGEPAPREPTLIAPRCDVARRSTDVLAIDDPELAASVRYIREQACQGISVEQVASKSVLSRSVLERRFKKLMGRSIKAEMTRVQLDQAKRLLCETDLSSALIAAKVGFMQPKYFSEVFHKKVGTTPGSYRKQAKKSL